MTDPTTTADPAVTIDPADPAVTTDPADTADTADPIGVGTLLTYGVPGDTTDPTLYLVTSAEIRSDGTARNLQLQAPDGYRTTLWEGTAVGTRTDGRGWQRAESPGAGISKLLATLAGRVDTAETLARNVRDNAQRDMAKFRAQVEEVAMRYARDNDWCATVARALAELEIYVEREVTVTGTFSVTMTLGYGDERPSRSDVLEALDSYDIDIDEVTDSE